jgi:hypothetical protein
LSPGLSGVGRPLAVVLSFALVYLYWRRRRGHAPEDVLALLALIFLSRCVLDPLDNAYYHVAFLLSLLTWEGLRRTGLPLLTLLSAAVLWITFHDPLVGHPAADNAFYLTWTCALAVWLGLTLYAPAALEALKTLFEARGRLAVRATRPTLHTPNT